MSLVNDQSTVRVTPLCNRARTLERIKSQDPSREYYLLSFEEVRLCDSTCWLYIEIQIGSSATMAVGYSRYQASINLEPYLRCVFRPLDVYRASLLRPDKRRRPRPHPYVCAIHDSVRCLNNQFPSASVIYMLEMLTGVSPMRVAVVTCNH